MARGWGEPRPGTAHVISGTGISCLHLAIPKVDWITLHGRQERGREPKNYDHIQHVGDEMETELKALVSKLGDALDKGAPKDEVFSLIYKALKALSEREVAFIDTSGNDPSAPNSEDTVG